MMETKEIRQETGAITQEAIGQMLTATTQSHLAQCFVFDGLRTEFQTLIEQMHTSLQVPRDMVFGTMLGVASAVLCGRHSTKYLDYEEVYANLPIVVFAPSGGGKSPTFNGLTAPLVRIQAKRYERYKEELREWDAAGKNGPKPVFRRLFVQDSTIEKVCRCLVELREGMAVMTDESLLDILTGYRDKSGAQMAVRMFIRALDAGPIDISRAARDDTPLYTPHGILSLCAVTQPSDIPMLFDEWSIRKGLAARFLMVYTDLEKKEDSAQALSVDYDYWNTALEGWLIGQPGATEAQFHPLEAGAVEAIKQYCARKEVEIFEIMQKLEAFGAGRQQSTEWRTLTFLQTMCSKQKVIILRLALVLHFLSPYMGRISICADEIAYAISVMDTFEYYARKTIAEIFSAPGAHNNISFYGAVHQAWDALAKQCEETGRPMPSQAQFAGTFGIAPPNFTQKVLSAKY